MRDRVAGRGAGSDGRVEGREGQRRINNLGAAFLKFQLTEAFEDGSHGLFGDLAEVGASGVIAAFGGGVMAEEAEGFAGVAVVEREGPIEVAGAEDAEVVGPADAVGEEEEAFAEEGVGVAGSDGAGVGDGFGGGAGGHAGVGGVVAPVVGSGGTRGSEGGLHVQLPSLEARRMA